MSQPKKELVNFNTVLITVCLGLFGWIANRAMDKLDTIGNTVIQHEVQIPALTKRVEKLESKSGHDSPVDKDIGRGHISKN